MQQMSDQQGHRFVVVDPDGQPDGAAQDAADRSPEDDGSDPGGQAIGEPAKVMRIGTMIKQLLEEVRATELDDASRRRLKEIHASSLAELESALSPELREELARIIAPFDGDDTPTDGELRIAQAQLVGWLEGLFHGIQTALVAQQMAARVQLEQMRRGLPAGGGAGTGGSGSQGATGQYL